MPPRAEPDACPGALRVHGAADGGLARVRVPGGRLDARQVRALAAAAELGDGGWELTSRANLQVRGLAPRVVAEFADRLADAGLLPSPTHERVRNIIASPYTGCDDAGSLDVHAVSVELDRRLRAAPALAELPGRFLFTVDDGRGDVGGLAADVGLRPDGDAVAVLLSGADKGIRVAAPDAPRAAVLAAEAFLAERARQESASWRLAELTDGADRVARRVLAELGATSEAAERALSPTDRVPATHADLGILHRRGGRASLALGAPLGRLNAEQVALLAAQHRPLRLTPWRTLLLTDIPERAAGTLLSDMDEAGFVVDPAAPLAGVTACTGRPGCAKSLADVRSDAVRVARPGALPVHWAGCSRRCGRPAGRGVEVLATEAGYEVGGEPAGELSAALEAARRAV
ncbi:precorrin-3B synthase [Saccharopolyspora sp. NFXS83]|uniref:precorrin-3B synthase n=1 Tax=Saccharopolyspora sp. NFXS83 TaxID=2993560 RepID=UPI00224AE234|nr:precorrin-3B synthase [Saccharopolyspora sp. NFXS83]MCX2734282.1 precorrin-3B synthase [Saccharopolyspora sp. NFXS83]